jgi:L-alanine-DL-glutamate epimerase-like enolase superfamily enzyme
MIEMRAVDIIQPDVCYLGGLTRTMRVAAMGAEAGLPCTPHSANLSMVTVFTMHLLGAIPNAGDYLEFSIEEADYYPWQYGLFRNDPYKVDGGRVTIPSEPGWGVEIAPEWLARAAYQSRRREEGNCRGVRYAAVPHVATTVPPLYVVSSKYGSGPRACPPEGRADSS